MCVWGGGGGVSGILFRYPRHIIRFQKFKKFGFRFKLLFHYHYYFWSANFTTYLISCAPHLNEISELITELLCFSSLNYHTTLQ